MMPGSQSILDLVENHLTFSIPHELHTYASTIDDSLALRSPFETRSYRTWSKRIIADPIRLPAHDVAHKLAGILASLPVHHEVLTTSDDREDLLCLSALAERGSQRCIINITYIRETERLFVHLIVGTGVSASAPLER